MILRKIYFIQELSRGDRVSFTFKGKDLQANVVGLDKMNDLVQVQGADLGQIYLDINKNQVYLVYSPILSSPSPSCSCGSKFTSNPNFHLSYCSIAK